MVLSFDWTPFDSSKPSVTQMAMTDFGGSQNKTNGCKFERLVQKVGRVGGRWELGMVNMQM